MAKQLVEGCVGVAIKFLVKDQDGLVVTDLSTASTRELIFEKPSGTRVTKTATLTSVGSTDGKLHYSTEADFLNEKGTWSVGAKIVYPDGRTLFTTQISFLVISFL